MKKLSISERKLIVAKEEKMLADIAANQDIEDSMTKVGAIEGPKLAAAFLGDETIQFPPLDSSRNIATVLSLLGHATVENTKKIMKKYDKEILTKDKTEQTVAVKEYFNSLNIPGTKQFISDFKFKQTGGLKAYAKQAK